MSLTGSLPKGVSISPDGHTLYVTNYGNANGSNVFLYNAETLERTGQIDIPGIVVESALSPDGRMLYVSNFRRNTVQFVDLRTRRVRREVRAGAHPKVLALSRDGRRLFVANWSSASVTELDVARGTVTRTLRAGRNPRGMVMTAAGRLYIANFNGHTLDVYDGPTLSEHRRVTPLCRIPRHLALSPDDARLYVSCFSDSKLLVLSTQSDSIEREVSIGNWPKSIDVSADGRYVFSADYGGSSVSLVDTQDWSSATLDVPWMDHGSGVVAARRGHRFYATGWYDNHVFAVDFSQGITGLTPSDAMRALTLRRRDFHRLHPTE
ncbi:MAG: YncE family protein [Deltaproteobacteria bacterium]|nr:YncE family protein [Deltaproteobacteria bacterium]